MNGYDDDDDLYAWEQAQYVKAAGAQVMRGTVGSAGKEYVPQIKVKSVLEKVDKEVEKVVRGTRVYTPSSTGTFITPSPVVVLEAVEVIPLIKDAPQTLGPATIVPMSMVKLIVGGDETRTTSTNSSPATINTAGIAEAIGVLTIRAGAKVLARFAVGLSMRESLGALARDVAGGVSVRLSTGQGHGKGHYQRTRPEGGGWTEDDSDPADDSDWWDWRSWFL